MNKIQLCYGKLLKRQVEKRTEQKTVKVTSEETDIVKCG
jgi:hypothetical protein